ncbi:MAG TPA: hypothetical protein VER58_06095 [Thermoanaerobaculia bacterium]|nr:hypothetical protein [Thermoanaerobaculia bacterium]
MKKLVVLVVALFAMPLFAVSVTPEVSTLGYGVSAGFGVTPLFGIRVAGHTGSYSRDLHKESIAYNGKLKFNNYGGLLDIYPMASGFRLSGGIFGNDNKIDLASKPGQTITVNGVPYPSDAIGNVTGDVKFSRTSPYLGFGWGNKPSGHGFGVTFDLGVLYQGSPKLRVQANPKNPALVPASFYTNLETERAKTENDIKNYKYWPVVGVGFSFSF